MMHILLVDPSEFSVARAIKREFAARFPESDTVFHSVQEEVAVRAIIQEFKPEIVMVRGQHATHRTGPQVLTSLREYYHAPCEILLTGGAGAHAAALAALNESQRVHVVELPGLHFLWPLVGRFVAPAERIVFVDDDLDARDTAPLIFAPYAAELVVAEGAVEATGILRSSGLRTILVTDGHLGDGRGAAFLETVFTDPRLKRSVVAGLVWSATPFNFHHEVEVLARYAPVCFVSEADPLAQVRCIMDAWVARKSI